LIDEEWSAMTATIDLPPELERQLQEEAARRGLTPLTI
jgi:hypothetical protein